MENLASPMKFAITGGAGFVGSNIAKKLVDEGKHQILIIDNLNSGKLENLESINGKFEFFHVDIRDYDKMEEILKDVDGVFHQAALTVVQDSFTNKKEYEEVNVFATENIFRLAKEFGFKVVYASSSSVYGNTTEIPINENFELNPINPYGQTKLDGEKIARRYSEQNVSVIGLRYFNIFGERQNINYAGVITKFIDRLSKKESPIIFGKGNQIRDFIFVEDVADANIQLMKSKVVNGFFNVGSGNFISILDLANLMISYSNLSLKPIFENTLEGDVEKSLSDNSLIKNKVDWKPKMELKNWIKTIMKKLEEDN